MLHTFNTCDVNQDGLVSYQEFKKYFKDTMDASTRSQVLLQPNILEDKVDQSFQRADLDQSGTLDFKKWCAMSCDRRSLTEK
mmetsp:Transcript_40352/g.29064  ORF Transcript_40352/g.29064 Transcript_40352/m.29064 type:complete len:82 (+) Transcript_40352:459-704(+)